MAAITPMPTNVYINGESIEGVRSIEIRLESAEIQKATIVLFLDDVQITDDNKVYLKTK